MNITYSFYGRDNFIIVRCWPVGGCAVEARHSDYEPFVMSAKKPYHLILILSYLILSYLNLNTIN